MPFSPCYMYIQNDDDENDNNSVGQMENFKLHFNFN